jgi:hypothetical protein
MLQSALCGVTHAGSFPNKKIAVLKLYLGSWCLTTGLVLLTGCSSSDTTNQPENSIGPRTPNATTNNSESQKGSAQTHVVRAAITAEGMQVDERPKSDIHFIEWMVPRKKKQIDASKDWQVMHDFQYTDLQPSSGINFRHYPVDCALREYKSAHYDHGNGVAVADIDNDGLLDVYLATQIGSNALYRNLGNGQFKNITQDSETGLADRVSVSASFADIDNDGDADLFVTSVREGNKLFENDGNGRFTDITDKAGLGYQGHSSSALFFDFDRDGLLDVFLTNVGQYTIDEQAESTAIKEPKTTYYLAFNDAFSGHLKPERFEKSILYKNMGENVFKDVSQETGLVDESWSGAATPIDGNGDLWPDLYVTNMQGHDEYYENIEGTKFVRKSREVFPKTPWGSMGIKIFDFENDGLPDVYVTDMHSDMSENIPPEKEKLKADMQYPESFLQSDGASIYGNALYRKQSDGTFKEASDEVGAENYWPWGLSIGDLNADGFEDAFIASSMNYPFRYGVNSLLLNDHGKRFLDSEFVVNVEPRRNGRTASFCFKLPAATREFLGPSKIYLDQICKGRNGDIEVWGALGTRSSAIFDLENDGDLDIITNEFNAEPMVLVSNLSDKKPIHFLQIRLIGTKSNRDGLGAKVVLHSASGRQTRFHDGQSGYLSQSRAPLYFGLDEDTSVDKIEVFWPSGKQQTVEGPIDTNQTITVNEE